VVILVLVLLVFLFSSESSMVAGVKAIYGHEPIEYIQAAIDQGMATEAAGNTYWGAVRTAIIGAIWAFGGWAATTFVAGEVREATRTVPRILFGANIAILVLYIIISLLLTRVGNVAGRVGDLNFMNAVAYMGPGGGSFEAAGLPEIGPWMSNFAAIGAKGLFTGFLGSLLAFLILVFAILWAANDIPPFILVTSRTIFAMAFDRMLPERLGAIHEDYHSPVNAIILSAVIAILLGCTSESNALGNVGGFVGQWLNPASMLTATDVWSGIWDIFIVVALIFFPIRLPQLFERGPWRHSKNTTQVMGVIGLIFALYFMYSYLFDPNGWNLAGIGSLEDASALIGGGVVILIWIGLYFFYSNRAKVTGVNLTTIFADIPPE
jgi:amino acid transporter